LEEIDMELHDLTLKKEVAREGAWEVLARINKVEDIIGENSLFLIFLEIISKSFIICNYQSSILSRILILK